MRARAPARQRAEKRFRALFIAADDLLSEKINGETKTELKRIRNTGIRDPKIAPVPGQQMLPRRPHVACQAGCSAYGEIGQGVSHAIASRNLPLKNRDSRPAVNNAPLEIDAVDFLSRFCSFRLLFVVASSSLVRYLEPFLRGGSCHLTEGP